MGSGKPEIRGVAGRQARLAALVRRELAAGRLVDDARFDTILASEHYDLSPVHWTPLAVVRRFVDWVGPASGERILDVGAGCGKFCVAASLMGPGEYTGVELRPALVSAARALCAGYDAARVRFIEGDMAGLDWLDFDIYYLYNPFHENLLATGSGEPLPIDTTLDLGRERYRAYTSCVVEKLAACPRGRRLVTYNGFGAAPPAGWFRRRCAMLGGRALEFWERGR